MSPPRVVPLALAASSLLLGCRDDPRDSEDASFERSDATGGTLPDAGADCRTYVSDSLIDHACFHAIMGPYRDRAAAATAAPDEHTLDRAHTAFRVRLSEQQDGKYVGQVSYRARSSGSYAFFSASDPQLRILDASGRALTPFTLHPTEICAELPQVSAYAMSAGDFIVEIVSDGPHVMLVPEFMDEGTVADAYRFVCPPGVRPPVTDAAVISVLDGGLDVRAEQPHQQTLDATTVPLDATTVPEAQVEASGDAALCTIDPVLEHSCLHVAHGPFAMVRASSVSGMAPNVDMTHTAFTVVLTPGEQDSRVTYRPNGTGEYVFYLGRDVPLTLRAAGAPLTPLHVEPVTGCAGIVRAAVFSLTAGTRYEVGFTALGEPSTLLIVESVDAFTSVGWSGRLEACE